MRVGRCVKWVVLPAVLVHATYLVGFLTCELTDLVENRGLPVPQGDLVMRKALTGDKIFLPFSPLKRTDL